MQSGPAILSNISSYISLNVMLSTSRMNLPAFGAGDRGC